MSSTHSGSSKNSGAVRLGHGSGEGAEPGGQGHGERKGCRERQAGAGQGTLVRHPEEHALQPKRKKMQRSFS